MSVITYFRCVLTQEVLDAFCNTFHISEEVHPVLPHQDDTMHERPAGKIVLYTRFFYFDNFRLTLSTFLVDLLRHFRINISQLFVIGAAKVDDFACPAPFSWHTAKHVIRDPAPVTADLTHKIMTLLFLIPLHMDLFAFIHASDPTKVRVVEQEPDEGEPWLLETTVGRTILLLLVSPDRVESELEASVDKLFNEGDSGHQTEQGDSTGGGQDANIQPVVEAVDTIVEDAALVQSIRQVKRKSVVVDAGGASHPPKKLREDHGTLREASIGGKSQSSLQRLLVRAGLNTEVGVAAIPTLPFVTTSISTTPEHEDRDHTDSVAKSNLHAIRALSSAPIMTIVTTTTPTVDPTSITKEKVIEPSLFGAGSSFAGGTDPITGVFSDLTGSDFLVGAIRTIINPNTDLQKVYVPQRSVTNGSHLDDGRVCREMVDEFSPPKFFASFHGMKHDQLLTEFNVRAVHQMSLSAEVRMRAEYNFKEKRRLKSAIEIQGQVHELEISSFGLREKVTVYENCMEQLEKFQDDRMKIVKDNFDKLYTDFVKMVLHSEEQFYPHILTTISGCRWLLTHGIELAIAKFLDSPEYLFVLGAAIGKAIEKDMQDGLVAGITHGKEGRVLTDVAAHNPSAEADCIFAPQQLQNANFPLFAELKSNKDASVKSIMKILRLEDPVAEKLRVRQIRGNIANHRSVLRNVFVSLAEPFSTSALTGMEGTSGIVPATATTTALSTTLALTSTSNPISIDNYEFVDTNDQAVANEDAASFPIVDDAEFHIP
nr:transposase (putative), gypsy type [Tanacetum cinerariifolium]